MCYLSQATLSLLSSSLITTLSPSSWLTTSSLLFFLHKATCQRYSKHRKAIRKMKKYLTERVRYRVIRELTNEHNEEEDILDGFVAARLEEAESKHYHQSRMHFCGYGQFIAKLHARNQALSGFWNTSIVRLFFTTCWLKEMMKFWKNGCSKMIFWILMKLNWTRQSLKMLPMTKGGHILWYILMKTHSRERLVDMALNVACTHKLWVL